MSSVLLDGHTWLVIELSYGGMGSPFDGCCRRYHWTVTLWWSALLDGYTWQVETAWCMQVDFTRAASLSWWDGYPLWWSLPTVQQLQNTLTSLFMPDCIVLCVFSFLFFCVLNMP